MDPGFFEKRKNQCAPVQRQIVALGSKRRVRERLNREGAGSVARKTLASAMHGGRRSTYVCRWDPLRKPGHVNKNRIAFRDESVHLQSLRNFEI